MRYYVSFSLLFRSNKLSPPPPPFSQNDGPHSAIHSQFSVQNSDAFDRFCRFIDTLMLSPRVSNQSLKTFHLKCRSVIYNSDRQNFDAWVEAAKQRRVEEFHLIMNNATLNPTIFTSQTLVVLKLDKVEIEAEKLRVDLPSLKTLHLKHVCFENENDIKKLLKASPVLEDLHT